MKSTDTQAAVTAKMEEDGDGIQCKGGSGGLRGVKNGESAGDPHKNAAGERSRGRNFAVEKSPTGDYNGSIPT